MSDARDAVLGAGRARLGRRGGEPVRLPDELRAPVPAAPAASADLVARFCDALASAGGHAHVARGETAAAELLAAIAAETGARRVALSDSALVARLAAPLDLERVPHDAERATLLAADLGLTEARWAIAETGTVVLASDRERSRVVSLLPPVHVAIVRVSDVLAGLGDALAAIERERAAAYTFVTGPSRSADIEMQLVVGVHGPALFHAIVLEEP